MGLWKSRAYLARNNAITIIQKAWNGNDAEYANDAWINEEILY